MRAARLPVLLLLPLLRPRPLSVCLGARQRNLVVRGRPQLYTVVLVRQPGSGLVRLLTSGSGSGLVRRSFVTSVAADIFLVWRVVTLPEQELTCVIPDLRDLPLDRLAELGGSALAQSIALYRKRIKEIGIPLSSFNSSI